MVSSNASYSTDFSTIVRATRHADLSVNIHSLDAGGQDPLPRYLARAVMTFSQSEPQGEADLQGEKLVLMTHVGEPSGVSSLSGTTTEGKADSDSIGHPSEAEGRQT